MFLTSLKMDLSDSLHMQPDLEYLIWLHSIGLEEVLNEVPVNQFGEEYQNDFEGKISEDYVLKEKFDRKKIIQVKDNNTLLEKITSEISQLTKVSHLESYFKKFLNKEFDLSAEDGLYSSGAKKRSNIIVITETPLIIDFRNGDVYSGKKKSLLDGIISGIRSSFKDKDFGVIMAPVLPLPIGELNDQKNFEIYHFLYLEKLIKIIKPVLLILIGKRSHDFIKQLAEIKREKHNLFQIPYFVLPELNHILSVPKTKKDIWDNWKDLIKREKNESLF